MKIEIFTYKGGTTSNVNCSSCPKHCASKDTAVLTPEVLYNQLLALYGSNNEIVFHDFDTGDQEAIMERQNQLYKANGISRMVNKILIGPLSQKIWPSVVIDDKIKTEGTLLDATQIGQFMT